jgi:undecaprenyl pyrophosphate synthase
MARFRAEELFKALEDFAQRDRRFGKLSNDCAEG